MQPALLLDGEITQLQKADWTVSCRNRIGIAMIVLGLWSVVAFIVGFILFVIETWGLGTRLYLWCAFQMAHVSSCQTSNSSRAARN